MNEIIENNQEQTSVISNSGKELTNEEVASSLHGFGDLKLNLRIILGKVSMPIENFLKITRGTIIEIGKDKNTLFDVTVNEKNIGRCDVKVENEKVLAEIKQINKPKEF